VQVLEEDGPGLEAFPVLATGRSEGLGPGVGGAMKSSCDT